MDKDMQLVIDFCMRTTEISEKFMDVQVERDLARIKVEKTKALFQFLTITIVVISLCIVIFLMQRSWIQYLSGSEIITEYTITEQDGDGVNIIGEGNSVDGAESNQNQKNDQAENTGNE